MLLQTAKHPANRLLAQDAIKAQYLFSNKSQYPSCSKSFLVLKLKN